ncbi:MAG: hypothetical protein DDT19_01279 [Syntrophomonadaceae bacterium]|nr:hypothetical protein [Bacillota bacterium]
MKPLLFATAIFIALTPAVFLAGQKRRGATEQLAHCSSPFYHCWDGCYIKS